MKNKSLLAKFIVMTLITVMTLSMASTLTYADITDAQEAQIGGIISQSEIGAVDANDIKAAIIAGNASASKQHKKSGDYDNFLYVNKDGKDVAIAYYDSGVFYVGGNYDTVNGDKGFNPFVESLAASESSQDAVQLFLKTTMNNSSSPKLQTAGILEVFNRKADVYKALKVMKPMLDTLSLILGIGVVLIIIALMVSSVCDLVYIGLPIFRNTVENSKEGSKNGKSWIPISYDAQAVVQEIEGGGSGSQGGYQNGYILYLKRRILTYIVLAICILYLLGGGLSGVLRFILNLGTGLL